MSAPGAGGGRAPKPFTAVIVLHDSGPELELLLDSLDRHLPERPQLVAVDTGSRDDGPERARACGAEVVELGPGTWFGEANDAGVRCARAEVTVLLNPDVRLLDAGLLGLVAAAERRDALWAPRLLDPEGGVQRSAHPVPGRAAALLPALVHPRLLPRPLRLAADPWRAEATRPVGWAIAACLAARTATLRRLGPFGARPPLFHEDLDLCLRAAQHGVETVLEPSVRLLHRGGHATAPAYGGEPHELIARRRREVVGERLGPPARALDDVAQALTFATRAMARPLAGRSGRRPAAQLRALWRARR